MASQETSWPKKITVDKRIVTILSGSTYDNFPRALKEIITNSYDADASEVSITINAKSETITIEDNGIGLNESDFDFYLRIAGKSRTKSEFTVSGRRRIGQFGVGFLSVFPFCKNYNIESSKRGSNEILFASIPNYRYITKDDKLIDVDEIPIQGGKRIDNSRVNRQYTIIRLSGFTDLTKAFFKEAYKIQSRRKSILRYTAMERLKWELCEDLPLEFERKPQLNDFKYKSKVAFNVFLNDAPLFRNLHANNILETHKGEYEKRGKIKFKYFIATDYIPIDPVEARHLKIRNLNVGVGNRESFGVGIEGRTYARLAHLTGEIHILEGMNDLINVSRDGFNFSPDYEELKDFFRGRLGKWALELDRLAEAEKIGNETEDSNRIRNVEGLDKERVNKKIEELKSKGFKIIRSNTSSNKSLFKVNKDKKEVIVSESIDQGEPTKSIRIGDDSYKLKLAKWDDDDFPVCKVKGKSIIINSNYPLFSSKNRRYVDVFIKFHSILLMHLDEGSISKGLYKKILTDIETTFSDYIK